MTPAQREALATLRRMRAEYQVRQAARERIRLQRRLCPGGRHRWAGWLLMSAETGARYETRRCTRCRAAEIEALEVGE